MNPAQRTAGHQPQQERLGRNPTGQLPKSGYVTQGHASLLQFEMPQIFQNDVWHCHAKSRGKILIGHRLLFSWVSEQSNQAIGQIPGVSCLIELDGHSFSVRHLTKIFEIRANDWNSVSTGQVSDSAAPSGRRVGHDRDGRSLKKVRQSFFMHIASEFDSRTFQMLLLHRFHVPGRLRVVPAANHQAGMRQRFRYMPERLDHQFQPLVRSPLAKGQNAMLRISPPG